MRSAECQGADFSLVDYVNASSPSGEELSLTEALGMLRLVEDSLIRERLGETP